MTIGRSVGFARRAGFISYGVSTVPLIESSPDGTVVVLQTATSSYALRLDPSSAGSVHWGPRVTAEEAAALPARQSPHDDTFEGRLDSAEEFPYDGGARFGPAALAIRYPDLTGGLDLAVTGHEIHDGSLVVRLADRAGPIEADLHYRVRPGSDVIERWSVIRHDGSSPAEIQLTDHAAAVWSLPVRDDYRLSHVTGGWLREGALHRTPVPVAETTMTSRRGVTSHAANPWVMLDDGRAGEDTGEVWSAALAFSGSWRITVARTSAGRCSVLGAAGTDRTVTVLRPGDEVTSPVFAALRSTGGFGGASREWHAYQRRHVLPHPDELRPVLYNSWEATSFDVTDAGQRALAERAAKLGAELFVVDDGWFGARTSDQAGLGDWFPNPERFPDGLAPLAAYIRGLGMDFGLWAEPEMVNADSDLYRAHPDWVLHVPRLTPTELRNQLVLDFTRSDVRDWALGRLDELVRTTGLTFLKWDFNRAFTQARPESAIGHALGVYDVLDRLRAAHPQLRVEACAGGGGRVDLGILSRTDQAWTSDNTDAVDRLTIQRGYTQVYPAGTMVAWVTDSPNPMTGRKVSLRFRFHVAMAGVLGLGGDLTTWSDEELAESASLVAQYKEIRPVVQHGSLFRLPVGVQYLLDDRVVVLVFGASSPVPLHGLDAEAGYRDTAGRVFTGASLIEVGLPVGDAESELLTLTRTTSG
ncbi:MAG: alpha-galactosidase [Actinoplanes sp.]